MKTRLFPVSALVALAVLAGPAFAQQGADSEYRRMHATARSFAETYPQLSERYRTLEAAPLAQASALLNRSEALARDGQFDEAKALARSAYEGLREAITRAVASGPQG